MTRRTLSTALLSALMATPLVAASPLFAQAAAAPAAQEAPKPPALPSQKVLIHIHSNDPKDVQAAVSKANELMTSGKPGSTMVEILATGDGLKLVDKDGKMSSLVTSSIDKDVSFVACHNSMKSNHMAVGQLQAGVGVVPSGGREIALRKGDGWTILDDKKLDK